MQVSIPAGAELGEDEPIVTADGLYHSLASVQGGSENYLGPYVDRAPELSSCDGETGWYISWRLTIFKPEFDTTPDNDDCAGCDCQAGTVTTETGCLRVKITLGADLYGKSAGYLYVQEEVPSTELFTIARLRYSVADSVGVWLVDPLSGVSTFTTPTISAIVSSGTSDYTITLSNLSGGVFSTVNIAKGATTNNVVITETPSGGAPRVTQFNYSLGSLQWEMVSGGGLRKETRSYSWDVDNIYRTDTVLVKDNAGTLFHQETEKTQGRSLGIGIG